MLERDERWSLYFFYRNGDVTFMFQFSEVKEADRGITDPERAPTSPATSSTTASDRTAFSGSWSWRDTKRSNGQLPN